MEMNLETIAIIVSVSGGVLAVLRVIFQVSKVLAEIEAMRKQMESMVSLMTDVREIKTDLVRITAATNERWSILDNRVRRLELISVDEST